MKQPRQSSRSAPKTKTASARIQVQVQPGASADRLVGKTNEEWKIALTAPPVDGRANRACAKFLAQILRVPPSSVSIVRGETSRRKLIQIDGMLQSEVESKLEHAASAST
jgi:hypothetical protein